MENNSGDKILMNHPAYESDVRMGNQWYRARYKPGIREFGYPVRLPSEEWSKIAKIRGGFDERLPTQRKV